MKKNNDWLILCVLAVGGYFLLKSGAVDGLLNIFGLGSNNSGGGGGGGGSFFPSPQPGEKPGDVIPPVTPSPILPPGLKVGLIDSEPKIGVPQNYRFIGMDKTGYIQRGISLTTTPAMRNPIVVQSRAIIGATSFTDVGKLMLSIPKARKTSQVLNKKEFIQLAVAQPKALIQHTSGINVNRLLNIAAARPLVVSKPSDFKGSGLIEQGMGLMGKVLSNKGVF